jgi:hypothetical protein
MACGTPVLGFRAGAVPEVIDEGVTGLIVDSLEEAVAAMPRVLCLDRASVRRRFEERFLARRMALDYVSVYEDLLRRIPDNRRREPGAPLRGPHAPMQQRRVTVPTSDHGNGSRVHVD